MSGTSQLDRISSVRERSQAIGEFLEWLHSEKRWFLAEYRDNWAIRVSYNVEELLAEFFGIDLAEAELERRRILEDLARAERKR